MNDTPKFTMTEIDTDTIYSFIKRWYDSNKKFTRQRFNNLSLKRKLKLRKNDRLVKETIEYQLNEAVSKHREYTNIFQNYTVKFDG